MAAGTPDTFSNFSIHHCAVNSPYNHNGIKRPFRAYPHKALRQILPR